MLRILSLLLICLSTSSVFAGSLDTAFTRLNVRRIETNRTGMKVLGVWGLANTITGVAGAVSAEDEEWKRFHQMNAAWGIVNLAIAGLGYAGAGREIGKDYTNSDALHRY
jgi:hypothetical protein